LKSFETSESNGLYVKGLKVCLPSNYSGIGKRNLIRLINGSTDYTLPAIDEVSAISPTINQEMNRWVPT
jgi:hypothetical protein